MTDWIDSALCAQVGGDLWTPDHKGASVRAAKAVCARCEVREECLTAALQMDGNPGGVWGGTTERERRGMRKGAA